MNKFIYFDLECKNNPTVVGWKDYKAQGLSVAVIGYKKDVIDGEPFVLDENAEQVKHLFPSERDLHYVAITDPQKTLNLLKKFVEQEYKIVGYNTKGYDNALIAELCGEINPEEHLDNAIGGNKGSTTWREVEDGYINFLIDKKAGQYLIAEAIRKHRDGNITSQMTKGDLMYSEQIKRFLDDNSFDIMDEIINITGGKWASPFNLVCNLTIGYGKSDNGADVPEMYKNGEIERITKYCKHDVRLTWLLHEFIKKYKYILTPQYKDLPNLTQYQTIKVPFDGSVESISGKFIRMEHKS